MRNTLRNNIILCAFLIILGVIGVVFSYQQMSNINRSIYADTAYFIDDNNTLITIPIDMLNDPRVIQSDNLTRIYEIPNNITRRTGISSSYEVYYNNLSNGYVYVAFASILLIAAGGLTLNQTINNRR